MQVKIKKKIPKSNKYLHIEIVIPERFIRGLLNGELTQVDGRVLDGFLEIELEGK